MTYATRTDMEARFGTEEVGNLIDDADGVAMARGEAALADAAAVIDSYIGTAWSLPLASDVTWPLLRNIACDLARAELYDDSPNEEPEKAMKRAIRTLERLRDGEVNLVDARGRVAKRLNVAATTGSDRVFDDDAFEGFQ